MVALLPACGEKVPEGRMRGCEKYGLGSGVSVYYVKSLILNA